jgi:hypothetical protein
MGMRMPMEPGMKMRTPMTVDDAVRVYIHGPHLELVPSSRPKSLPVPLVLISIPRARPSA